MGKNNTASMIVDLDIGTKKKFKKLCTDYDTSMTDVVRGCIKTWIDGKEKKVVY